MPIVSIRPKKGRAKKPKQESEWPRPEPLLKLSPVAPFRPEMLPACVGAWVTDNARRMQVPVDLAAVGAVMTLAAATNRRVRIQPKQVDTSWQEPGNLWALVVAPPGAKKTAIQNAMVGPIFAVEQTWRTEDAQMWAEYHEAAKQAKRDKTEEPKRPAMRCLVTNDATVEALHECLRDNPGGVLVLHDELSNFLGNLQRPGRESERGFYLAAWSGSTPHQMRRIGRGVVSVPACCISMFGNVQPKRLLAYVGGESGSIPLSDDGLLQRFSLSVWPDPLKAFQYIDSLPDKTAEARVSRIVRCLARIDPEQPVVLKFSPEAQPVFVAWLTGLEQRLASSELNPLLAQFLAKYRGLMPRLSALFEIAEWADEIAPKRQSLLGAEGFVGFVGCRPVAYSNAHRAIQWVEYLETHARRICGLTDIDQRLAFTLAARIRSRDVPNPFTVRLIVQKGWAMLQSTAEANRACSLLTEKNWLRATTKQPGAAGGRPSVEYSINPNIQSDDPEEL